MVVGWNMDRNEAYATLELPVGASLEEIKRSYRNLAIVWHPDVVQRLLKIAEEARSELGDWNRQGRDQKPQQYKGNPNNPMRYPRVKGYWLDFLERQGIEIPDS